MVAAVAPRIVAEAAAGWIGRYERARPPLDRGPRAGLVGPRAQIPFVPSATLLLRAGLAPPIRFDETMPAGEDVDLVWRLVGAGWWVRYDPTATVAHAVRRGWRAWLTQRFEYGTTAGPLSLRHPAVVAPARIPASSALVSTLVLAARPVLAAIVAVGSAGTLARRLSGTVRRPIPLAIGLTARSTMATPPAVASGLVRAWGPALIGLLGWRRSRGVAAALLATPALKDWASSPDAPNLLGYVVAHLVDDLAYSVGVWTGCLRVGVLSPLVPAIVWGRDRSQLPPPAGRSGVGRVGLRHPGRLNPNGSLLECFVRRAGRRSHPALTPGRTRG